MKKQSWIRDIKRGAMKAAGLTFTQRVRESIRTGKPIAEVVYKKEGKQVVAVVR